MQNIPQNKPTAPASLRNLVIFVLGILVIPWTGWALDLGRGADPHNQQNSLGWLFFILTPLLLVLLLRAFAGDGWQDFGLAPRFKGNGRWYLLALLFHPLSMSLVMLAGVLLGVTSVLSLTSANLGLLGGTILALLLPSIVKNIFEEFAWRGYLAPKVRALGIHPLLVHVIVGLVWFSWHLVYYLQLMSPADLAKATSLNVWAVLGLTLPGIIFSAMFYDELRFRTGSLWPALVIHTAGNVFFDALVATRFFNLPNLGAEVILSPAMFSLVSILLTAAAGLWMYRKGTGHA